MTSVLFEYLKIYSEYSKKYEKTAVLIQVGSFFEIYGVDNAAEMSKILNIEMEQHFI